MIYERREEPRLGFTAQVVKFYPRDSVEEHLITQHGITPTRDATRTDIEFRHEIEHVSDGEPFEHPVIKHDH